MSQINNVPFRILQGMVLLTGLEGCEIIGKPSFQKEEKRWLVNLRITIDTPSEYVPAITEWCALIDVCYPLGNIDFYPAKTGGMTATFPHQSRNEEGDKHGKWRKGRVCIDTPIGGIGVLWQGEDPVGNTDTRLCWYGKRMLSWLSAAARGELLIDGDPFELPAIPLPLNSYRIAHDEDEESLSLWSKCRDRIGLITLEKLPDRNYRLAVSFEELNGNIIRRSPWYLKERSSTGKKDTVTGIWWRWDLPIVNPPWEAPLTWGELIKAGKHQNINTIEILRTIVNLARDKDIQYLFLGFPISKYVGGPHVEMHWQTIKLPAITRYTKKPPRGFRPNKNGHWMEDRRTKLADHQKMEYMHTDNWHEKRLLARGGFDNSLRDKKITLIGAGALGSAIGEYLARGGIKNMHIIDEDIIKAGNLVRHTLTMQDIGKRKAEALKNHLTSINPNITVTHSPDAFSGEKWKVESTIMDADIVIDCTASDHVLASMSQGWWSIPKIFSSISLGFRGKRMFLYLSDSMSFSMNAFREDIEPWLEFEKQKLASCGEVIEGAGCWSPVFPCRFDDVTLAASIAVKVLEKAAISRPFLSGLFIFEQQENAYGIPSYNLIVSPEVK